ncbi:NTF2- export protein 2 [Geranomyces variabilis]|uniref:NTF2- export protein 2 n=1 Tax=Geranomyces variabilis TaxID=109894 RepID=A0AAD5XQG4_9FUNG|nr:NTF2- export protein 2 [Geranomyces variabilis]
MAEAEEIVVTTRAADMFVPSYYKVYDRQRHLLHQFYKDGSAVLWNGSALPGHSCSEFFLKLPATDHHVNSYDAQPVMDRGQILLTVSAYDLGKTKNQRHFHKYSSSVQIRSKPKNTS